MSRFVMFFWGYEQNDHTGNVVFRNADAMRKRLGTSCLEMNVGKLTKSGIFLTKFVSF